MPGINGLEFANEIRQYNQNVRILLLTAYFDEDSLTIQDFINADFAEGIEKPVSIRLLKSRVRLLFNSAFTKQQNDCTTMDDFVRIKEADLVDSDILYLFISYQSFSNKQIS